MDKPDLLAEFKRQLEAFDQFQGYIDKAQAAREKFRPEVVAKVVADNTARMQGVAEILDPLVPEVQKVIADLEAARAGIQSEVETARLGLEELELRQMIGELDDDAFEAEAGSLRSAVEDKGESLASLDAELAEFRDVVDGWSTRRPDGAADDDLLDALEDDEPAAFEPEPVAEPEPEPAPAPVIEEEEPFFVDDEGDGGVEIAIDDTGFDDPGARGNGVHVEQLDGVVDDVSAVFEDEDPGLALDDLGGSDPEPTYADEDLADLGEPVASETPADDGDAPAGEALLILGEGTDEEHVYPFTGEVISLGRGRDNTIQVKNDSKVSRYHCKLFKKDTSFFIEDNKSANGTLVDGELITEKRLLGGEEIIIGETFFRFRINL